MACARGFAPGVTVHLPKRAHHWHRGRLAVGPAFQSPVQGFWERVLAQQNRRRPYPAAVLQAALCREAPAPAYAGKRSEEHTSELQSLMRSAYAVFRFTKKTIRTLVHITDKNT